MNKYREIASAQSKHEKLARQNQKKLQLAIVTRESKVLLFTFSVPLTTK
jgi:hypothetical protein